MTSVNMQRIGIVIIPPLELDDCLRAPPIIGKRWKQNGGRVWTILHRYVQSTWQNEDDESVSSFQTQRLPLNARIQPAVSWKRLQSIRNADASRAENPTWHIFIRFQENADRISLPISIRLAAIRKTNFCRWNYKCGISGFYFFISISSFLFSFFAKCMKFHIASTGNEFSRPFKFRRPSISGRLKREQLAAISANSLPHQWLINILRVN